MSNPSWLVLVGLLGACATPRTAEAPLLFSSGTTSTPCNGPCATTSFQLFADGRLVVQQNGEVLGRFVLDEARVAELRRVLDEATRPRVDPSGLPPPDEPNDLHASCTFYPAGSAARDVRSASQCAYLEALVRGP